MAVSPEVRLPAEFAEIAPRYDYDAFTLPDSTTIRVFLGDHEAAADAGAPGELRTRLDGVDILIPELVSWAPQLARDWQKISDGDRRLTANYQQALARQPYDVAFLSEILDCGVKLSFIDLPAGNQQLRSFQNHKARIVRHMQTAQTFEQALASERELQEIHSANQLRREQYMLEQLTPAIDGLTSRFSRLDRKRKSDELVVAISIGGVHAALHAGLQHRQAMDSSMNCTVEEPEWGFESYFAAPNVEIHGRLARGLGLPDELLAQQVLLIEKLFMAAPDFAVASQAQLKTLNEMFLEGKTLEELEKLYETIQKQGVAEMLEPFITEMQRVESQQGELVR